jgi:hypothetical protein
LLGGLLNNGPDFSLVRGKEEVVCSIEDFFYHQL